MKQNKRNDLLIIFAGIVMSYFFYLAVIQSLSETLADYNGHTYVYLPMFTGSTWFDGWKMVPYCMWHLCVLGLNHLLHIPLEDSVAYVSCFFQLFTYLVMYWMLRRFLAARGTVLSTTKACAIALGLSISQSLYFHWMDTGDRFLGTFSMNPLHNPTHTCVRPFALLCFCLVCDIWGKQKDDNYRGIFFQVERGLKRYYIYLAILLMLSSMAKPVFMEMFVPAVGIVMLAEWICRILRKDGSARPYFKHCLWMLLCAAPSLLYILLQFLAYFFWGGSYGADGSFMITRWMEVWSIFSENIILSIALGMAFPLYVMLIDIRYFLRQDMGRLALTGYVIGILEAALLGEGGSKLSHADFIWPMMCGMLLVWMTAILRLLDLEETQTGTKGKRLLVGLGWMLFSLHILFGILYLKDMICT